MTKVKKDSQYCKDLIEHCITHMCSANTLEEIYEIKCTSATKYLENEFVSDKNERNPSVIINKIAKTLRKHWTPTNKKLHINNLMSGKLSGHNWHQTRPSSMHLSIQDKVRNLIQSHSDLDSFLEEGKDIFKQEYFIVAQHDLCESTIIECFPGETIPPDKKRSITDFIFRDIPYDLKVTTFPSDWENSDTELKLEDKLKLATNLYGKADSERIRKQAERTKHNWGLNRMYVVVKNPDEWLKEPERLLEDLTTKLKDEQPFKITITPNKSKTTYEITCLLVVL